MKHILKITALLVTISAIWTSLLETSVIPRSYTWLLPVYLIMSLGCYGLLMVGVGLMLFPTCPQEAVLLQKVVEFLASSKMLCCQFYSHPKLLLHTTKLVLFAR